MKKEILMANQDLIEIVEKQRLALGNFEHTKNDQDIFSSNLLQHLKMPTETRKSWGHSSAQQEDRRYFKTEDVMAQKTIAHEAAMQQFALKKQKNFQATRSFYNFICL